MKTGLFSFSILLTTLLIAVLSGCARGPISLRFGADDPETKFAEGLDNQKLEELVSWDEVSQTVFFNANGGRCNQCHDSDEAPNLTSYNEFKTSLRDLENEIIIKRSMPKKRTLTAEQYNLVKLWIAQGAPEKGRPFGEEPTPPTSTTTSTSTTTILLPDSTTTTSNTTSTSTSTSTTTTLPVLDPIDSTVGWDEVSQKVFFNANGGRCNACHDNDDEPNLTNYQEFKAELANIQTQVLENRKMPKKRKLTEEQIALVKMWIEQGAPEKGRQFSP